jgi:hypothetical protein
MDDVIFLERLPQKKLTRFISEIASEKGMDYARCQKMLSFKQARHMQMLVENSIYQETAACE